MPALEVMDLIHYAVLWPWVGVDRRAVVKVSATPSEIRCRWSNKQKRMLDPNQNEIAVDATVIVAQDIVIDSIMWLGQEDDIPGTSGIPESGLFQVKAFDRGDELKGRILRRQVGLIRFNDTFPTTV